MPLVFVILGRQGSGKGTQAALIVERYGLIHISTGDMLRNAVEAGTDLGLQAKTIMDAGELVGDDIINSIVAERLEQPDIQTHGVLLDGFPRTTTQADALARILQKDGPNLAINLNVPIEEVTRRMLDRGRGDDTAEAIARRLELYETQTAPLLTWFQNNGCLQVIDGRGSEQEVFARLVKIINNTYDDIMG
ncbi:MAG: adenylate kinase [Acidimicrobiia bacterium]|nr:adenylate kinase [Acidimicrobiia bacterium]MYC58326.1 adenylate kinase [Acidimicrobiia bacterium]MYG93501.1 adenylate kinase [Acidimicrobiia bacterium]MYI29967.1 adenylate kinase [Acidimicrobiia bacterium]